MSKWLAIFGLLLASAPVMPGQPDQASKPKQSTANQVQKESNPVGATEVDKQASGQTDQAKAEANPPDWYTALERPDWWLVIVATITAGVICWQSIETRKAAQGAKENAEAALSQIRMTMEKERARIGVDLVDLKLDVVPDQHSAVEVGWSVTLYGQTDAFIHDSQCFAEVEGQNLPHHIRPAWGEMVGLPSVLSCDRRNVKGNVMGHPPRPYPFDYASLSDRLVSGDQVVICVGFVEYSDVFGGRWIFRFKRRWSFFGKPDELGGLIPRSLLRGEWAKCGSMEENGEYPAKKTQKPN
jgi:hypothetical protein